MVENTSVFIGSFTVLMEVAGEFAPRASRPTRGIRSSNEPPYCWNRSVLNSWFLWRRSLGAGTRGHEMPLIKSTCRSIEPHVNYVNMALNRHHHHIGLKKSIAELRPLYRFRVSSRSPFENFHVPAVASRAMTNSLPLANFESIKLHNCKLLIWYLLVTKYSLVSFPRSWISTYT